MTARKIGFRPLKPVRILFQDDGVKQNHGKNHDKIPISVHMMDSELEELVKSQPDRTKPEETSHNLQRKLMFDIHPRIAYNLADQDFSRVLTLHQDFKRKDLMKEGNRPYSITYRIAYALSNTHHSDLFLRKEYIEIPRIFKEFAKQPVIGRYEGTLEIAGHEILVTGTAGRKWMYDFGVKFPRRHKPWGRKEYFAAYIDSGSGICTAKPGVFPKEARKPCLQQGLIDSDSFYEESKEEIKNLKEAMQELKSLDISEESKLSLENVKRLIQRNFSENPLAWWDRNKIEATLKLKEECKYEYVRYKPIQMNMEDKKDMQMIIKSISILDSSSLESLHTVALDFCREHLIDCIKGAKVFSKFDCKSGFYQIKMESIFIKDLAKYRKDFRPLLKETESAKWKWEEIHTQRVRELKQVCNNLPKLAIPQDEDELVVYTDANDYRWAAVLMKKTTTGEEPCRYTGGLFTEQQAQVWHINEKEFFAVWKAFKKWPLFLLAKEFTLKVDNTNVKAFLKNKLESKIEKARIIRWQAECQYYCYNIVVIKSHENVLADFLTRDGGS
ncbi:UNVERIFIED_CONTAM: movement protein [Sesamum calycinum]|uniref:Movement protein n=1 Tax=Sesamum calycinum TaxID=2727403 RepID=A0AAW2NVA7_9LAMI